MTTFRVGAATDVGRVRSNNQDSNLVGTNLYAVADGMGGHQGGEVASAIAVDTLRDVVTEPTADSLIEGVKLANTAIHSRQAEVPQLRGMGTTLCAVALVETPEDTEEILVVNVGDSRVYLFHDGELAQITNDHSLVEDLRREGRLTAEEAAVHPHRNVLTRALGIDANVVVDDFRLIPQSGDRYLLCSDGLFNEVSEDRIAATLRRLADPADVASELVRQANENGGRDNITCLVVDVADAAAAAPTTGRTRNTPLRAATVTGESPVSAPPPVPSDDGADLAGFTQPVPEASEALATGAAGEDAPAPSALAHTGAGQDAGGGGDGDEPTIAVRRRRRFTWRVLVFAVAFLVVVAAAVVVIAWQGRGTYYVAFDHEQLVVYQGTPGGLLGINPTLYRRCPGLTLTNIPTTLAVQIRNKKTFTTFPDGRTDALAYVARVAKQANSTCVPTRSSPGTGPLVTLPSGSSTSSTTATTSPSGALNPGAGAGNAGATTSVGLAPLSPVTLTHPRPASGLP